MRYNRWAKILTVSNETKKRHSCRPHLGNCPTVLSETMGPSLFYLRHIHIPAVYDMVSTMPTLVAGTALLAKVVQ